LKLSAKLGAKRRAVEWGEGWRLTHGLAARGYDLVPLQGGLTAVRVIRVIRGYKSLASQAAIAVPAWTSLVWLLRRRPAYRLRWKRHSAFRCHQLRDRADHRRLRTATARRSSITLLTPSSWRRQ